MTNTAYSNIDTALAQDVDALGEIKAQIAALKEREAEFTARIIAAGPGAYEGLRFRATVSACDAAFSLDAKAAEEKLRELGVDGRWFSRHQKERKAYTAVRVAARKSA